MPSFLRQLWFGESRGIAKAALLVSFASILSRLMGVYRDRVLASTFGAGPSLDAYYAAFRLPDLLYTLFILGALTAGFIPVFTDYWENKSPQAAKQLSETVISVVGCGLAGAGLLLFFLAPYVVPLTIRGFSAETVQSTVYLTRIMCLSPLILGLSAVMGGVLQATHRLFAFAFAPLFYNLGIIFGAIFIAPRIGIAGLAWGVVLGAAMHFLIQSSVAWHLGVRHIVRPSLASPGVRSILSLMGPRTIGLAVNQINAVILLSFAASLSSGSVSIFTLANNVQSFPIGIIGVSFAIAAFPALSSAAAQKKDEAFRQMCAQTIRRILFFLLPIAVLFFVLRTELIGLLLGQGKFDVIDSARASTVLGWFAISLPAQALIPLLARIFYARQNTWTPLWISLASEAVILLTASVFRHILGVAGLAAAFSLAAWIQAIFLWIMLRRGHVVDHHSLFPFVSQMMLAIGASGIAMFFMERAALDGWLGTFFVHPLWRLGFTGSVGVALFILCVGALGVSEGKELWQKIAQQGLNVLRRRS